MLSKVVMTDFDEDWKLQENLREERKQWRELEEQLEWERNQCQGGDTSENPFTPMFFQNLMQMTMQAVVSLMLIAPAASWPIHEHCCMPTLGTGGAPTTFTGAEEKALLMFFPHLERCFDKAGVVDDADKTTYVMEYVSDKIVDFVKNLDGYKTQNYDQLKTEMYAAWGNPQTGARYTYMWWPNKSSQWSDCIADEDEKGTSSAHRCFWDYRTATYCQWANDRNGR
jgi:hypothetical protein